MKNAPKKSGENPAHTHTPKQSDRREQPQGEDRQTEKSDNPTSQEPRRYDEQPLRRDQQPQGQEQQRQSPPSEKDQDKPIAKNAPGRDIDPSNEKYLSEDDELEEESMVEEDSEDED